jgi:hypothetical protein
MKRAAIILLVLCMAPLALLFPQEKTGASNFYGNPELKLDLPLFSLPYQIDAANIPGYNFFDSYTHPDMAASLAVTGGVYSSLHFGMKKLRDLIGQDAYWKRFVYHGGVGLGDYLLYQLPIPTGYVWMHESFHRAGFTRMGLRSHINFVFPAGGYAINDSGGNIYKYDLPRTLAAGIESGYLLIEKMQRNNFFYDQRMPNEFLYWLANFQAWYYSYLPFLSEGMTMTVEGKEQEVSADSLQWAYYLFHPEEHITMGSEDEEVIGLSDLQDREKKFLETRVLWALANFASPMMFGVHSIPLRAGFSGNFALRQFYTSFGTDLSVNVYLKRAPFNLAFAYHSYMNYDSYFPAIEAELADFPVRLAPRFSLLLSPRILLGVQPRDQDFMTADMEFFALAGLRVDFALHRNILPYMEFTAKTDGWVAGNEYLEAAASVRLGISARF